MPMESNNAKEVLERILSSYGVSSRQEYSERLSVPLGTIGNWVSRGSVPGDYIIRCALDTGADLDWLVNGKLKNVSSQPRTHQLKGQALLEHMAANGGKTVLQRILHAYGFTMQKELGDLLGIPSGTMSAWVRREYFPGDVVIACALDTGASLLWLSTGLQDEVPAESPQNFQPDGIPKFKLIGGNLEKQPDIKLDLALLGLSMKKPVYVERGTVSWIIEEDSQTVGNGDWLLDIDGNKDVYSVSRLPGNRLKVVNNSSSFECSVSDVTSIGMVILTLTKNI